MSPHSSCSALNTQNSNQIDKGNFGALLLNNPRENDNIQSLNTESDRNVGKSCNGNLYTNQRAAYMRQYRITNVSPEKMAKRNEYQRNYRTTNASPGKKEKSNECQRNYRTSSLSMECAITKFHQIVSQGPLYVYTCCG